MGSLDRRIEALEQDARPREWDRRVQVAARIHRQIDDLPLENAARYVAACEAAGWDDPRLMEEHLGISEAEVNAVVGSDEAGMRLWRDALRGLFSRAHSSAHRPAFLDALRREREARGLTTETEEER